MHDGLMRVIGRNATLIALIVMIRLRHCRIGCHCEDQKQKRGLFHLLLPNLLLSDLLIPESATASYMSFAMHFQKRKNCPQHHVVDVK